MLLRDFRVIYTRFIHFAVQKARQAPSARLSRCSISGINSKESPSLLRLSATHCAEAAPDGILPRP